jgi:hypothetical protein
MGDSIQQLLSKWKYGCPTARHKQTAVNSCQFPIALNDSSHHRKDLGLSVYKWAAYKRDRRQVESKLFNMGYSLVKKMDAPKN